MEISLLRGRQFEPSDNADAPQVAIVNAALAKRYWPNKDPIGKRINIGGSVAKGQMDDNYRHCRKRAASGFGLRSR